MMRVTEVLYSSFFPSNLPTVHKKEIFFSFTTIHDDDVIFSPIVTQEGTKKVVQTGWFAARTKHRPPL